MLRLLLTAGVCEQRLGGFHRLFLTAGVFKQRFSPVLWLLLNAGIGDQRLDAVRRRLPTTCVCDQRLGTVHRLLPNTGVCDQRLDPVLDFCPLHVYAGFFLAISKKLKPEKKARKTQGFQKKLKQISQKLKDRPTLKTKYHLIF